MAEGGLTLWGVGTPRTMRAHWIMLEFGLDYDMRPIQSRTGETRTPEFLALNPRHKIPVLQHGDLTVTESTAIITYVSESFEPPARFFVPGDALRRAKLNEWCSLMMMELDALSLYLIRLHHELADIYGAAPDAVASAKKHFADQTHALFGGRAMDHEFLMPEGMSVADILMTTMVDSAYRREIDVPGTLADYLRRMIARPAYQGAFERNYQDRPLVPPNLPIAL